MAYGVYIAAIDPKEIERLRAGAISTLRTRAVIGMTHLVVNMTKEKLLGETLNEIVDGGSDLGGEFWHPYRPPIMHPPEEVRALELALRTAWQALPAETQAEHLFRNEIGELLVLLSSAERDGSALLSVLEPPGDEERASKVRCPFDDSVTLPFPWGELVQIEKEHEAATKAGLR